MTPKRIVLFLICVLKVLGAVFVGTLLLIGGYATWLLWSFELWVKGWE